VTKEPPKQPKQPKSSLTQLYTSKLQQQTLEKAAQRQRANATFQKQLESTAERGSKKGSSRNMVVKDNRAKQKQPRVVSDSSTEFSNYFLTTIHEDASSAEHSQFLYKSSKSIKASKSPNTMGTFYQKGDVLTTTLMNYSLDEPSSVDHSEIECRVNLD
jgi:hypothetical protein